MASVGARERSSLELRVVARVEPSTVRDLLLVGLAFASGAGDAIAFLGLDKVFSAFMTGNLVFLGLRLGGEAGPDLLRVIPALAGFAVGVFLATRLVKASKGSGLWPKRVSLALGLGALAQAAFLVGWLAASGRPSTGVGDLLVGLAALAFGIQSGAIMSLEVRGVFTTAATATLIMLMSDEAGWAHSAPERRRLLGVLAGLIAGAAVAAFLIGHARSYAPVLPLAVILAVIGIAASTGLDELTP